MSETRRLPRGPVRALLLVSALPVAIVLAAIPARAEEFRQIRGAAIRATFAGRVLTDNVHWRFTFRRDGSLPSASLGREKVGSWTVKGDRLCMVQGIGGDECYTVWRAGASVQLRPGNDVIPVEEGVLEEAGPPTEGRR